MEEAEKVQQVAKNSAGSAWKEQTKWAESLQGHLGGLSASWEKFSQVSVNNDSVKFFIDLTKGVLDFGSAIGGVVPVLTVFSAVFLGIKSKTMVDGLIATIPALKSLESAFVDTTMSATAFKAVLTGGLALAVVGTVALVKELWQTTEEIGTQLENISQEYKKHTDNIDEYNNKLETNKQRLEELNKIKNSTGLTEKQSEELSLLQQQNTELERKLALEENLAKLKGAELQAKAQEKLNHKEVAWTLSYDESANNVGETRYFTTQEDRIKIQLEEYKKIKDKLKAVEKDMANGLTFDENINKRDRLTEAQSKLGGNLGVNLSDFSNTVNNLNDSAQKTQLLQFIENANKELTNLVANSKEAEQNISNLTNISSQAKPFDILQEKQKNLQSYYDEYNKNGVLSNETVQKAVDNGLADYLVKTADGYKLNSDALTRLNELQATSNQLLDESVSKAQEKINTNEELTTLDQNNLELKNMHINTPDGMFKNNEVIQTFNSVVEKFSEINQKLIDGKSSINEYFDEISKGLNDIDTSKLTEPLSDNLFYNLASNIENAMNIATKEFNTGKMSILDYSKAIQKANENTIQLQAKSKNLYKNQDGKWSNTGKDKIKGNADDMLDVNTNSISDAQKKLKSFDGYVTLLSDHTEYLKENLNSLGDVAFDSADVGTQAYKNLTSELDDVMDKLATTNETVFNSVVDSMMAQTSLTRDQILDANGQFNGSILNNASNTNVLMSAMSSALGLQVQDTLGKLGKMISTFKASIEFEVSGQQDAGISIGDWKLPIKVPSKVSIKGISGGNEGGNYFKDSSVKDLISSTLKTGDFINRGGNSVSGSSTTPAKRTGSGGSGSGGRGRKGSGGGGSKATAKEVELKDVEHVDEYAKKLELLNIKLGKLQTNREYLIEGSKEYQKSLKDEEKILIEQDKIYNEKLQKAKKEASKYDDTALEKKAKSLEEQSKSAKSNDAKEKLNKLIEQNNANIKKSADAQKEVQSIEKQRLDNIEAQNKLYQQQYDLITSLAEKEIEVISTDRDFLESERDKYELGSAEYNKLDYEIIKANTAEIDTIQKESKDKKAYLKKYGNKLTGEQKQAINNELVANQTKINQLNTENYSYMNKVIELSDKEINGYEKQISLLETKRSVFKEGSTEYAKYNSLISEQINLSNESLQSQYNQINSMLKQKGLSGEEKTSLKEKKIALNQQYLENQIRKAEMERSQRVSNVQDEVETTLRILTPLENKLSLIQMKLDLLSSEDYVNRIDMLGEAFADTQSYVAELSSTFSNLNSIQPQTKEEAESIANAMRSVADKIKDGKKAMWEYQKQMDIAKVDQYFKKFKNNINELVGLTTLFKHNLDMLNGGLVDGTDIIFSMPTLPEIPQANYDRERSELNALLSDQESFENSIKAIKERSYEEQISEIKELNDLIEGEQKNHYQEQLEIVGKGLEKELDVVDTKHKNILEIILSMLTTTENKYGSVWDGIVSKVSNALDKIKDKSAEMKKVQEEMTVTEAKTYEYKNYDADGNYIGTTTGTNGQSNAYDNASSIIAPNGKEYAISENTVTNGKIGTPVNSGNSNGNKTIGKVITTIGDGLKKMFGYANGTPEGGHQGGVALVGEEGEELAILPSGKSIMLGTYGAELVDLPKGSTVITAPETKELKKELGNNLNIRQVPAYRSGILGAIGKTIIKEVTKKIDKSSKSSENNLSSNRGNNKNYYLEANQTSLEKERAKKSTFTDFRKSSTKELGKHYAQGDTASALASMRELKNRGYRFDNTKIYSVNGTGFAYVDKYGVSHVVDDYETALQYSRNGASGVYEYDGDYFGGSARDGKWVAHLVNLPFETEGRNYHSVNHMKNKFTTPYNPLRDGYAHVKKPNNGEKSYENKNERQNRNKDSYYNNSYDNISHHNVQDIGSNAIYNSVNNSIGDNSAYNRYSNNGSENYYTELNKNSTVHDKQLNKVRYDINNTKQMANEFNAYKSARDSMMNTIKTEQEALKKYFASGGLRDTVNTRIDELLKKIDEQTAKDVEMQYKLTDDVLKQQQNLTESYMNETRKKYLDGINSNMNTDALRKLKDEYADAQKQYMSIEKAIKDNIKSRYDYEFALIDKKVQKEQDAQQEIQNQLALLNINNTSNSYKEKQDLVSKDMQNLLGQKDTLQNELGKLRKTQNTFSVGSYEWNLFEDKSKDIEKKIFSVNKAIKSDLKDVYEYSFSMIDKNIEKYTDYQNKLNTELDLLNVDTVSKDFEKHIAILDKSKANYTDYINYLTQEMAILRDKQSKISPTFLNENGRFEKDLIEEKLKDLQKQYDSIEKHLKENIKNRYSYEFALMDKTIQKHKEIQENISLNLSILNSATDNKDFREQIQYNEELIQEYTKTSAELLDIQTKLKKEQSKFSLNSYEWNILEEKIKDVNKQFLSAEQSISATISANKKLANNRLSYVFETQNKTLEELLYGDKRRSEIEREQAKKKQNQADYLEGLEKEYQLELMKRDLTKEEISDFDKILDIYNNQDKIRREDFEITKKQIDIKKLEKELDKAMQNLTEKTYTKDKNGNWDWKYQADADLVKDLSDQLTEAKIDLLNLQKNKDFNVVDNKLKDVDTFMAQLKELQNRALNGEIKSKEEFDKELQKIGLNQKDNNIWDILTKNKIYDNKGNTGNLVDLMSVSFENYSQEMNMFNVRLDELLKLLKIETNIMLENWQNGVQVYGYTKDRQNDNYKDTVGTSVENKRRLLMDELAVRQNNSNTSILNPTISTPTSLPNNSNSISNNVTNNINFDKIVLPNIKDVEEFIRNMHKLPTEVKQYTRAYK